MGTDVGLDATTDTDVHGPPIEQALQAVHFDLWQLMPVFGRATPATNLT
jgi:hypothetical protein